MSDTISEAAKRKAEGLIADEIRAATDGALPVVSASRVLARVLQDVSDRVKPLHNKMQAFEPLRESDRHCLQTLILPDDPVDPLEECLAGIVPDIGTRDPNETPAAKVARELRAALAKHGLTITAKE